jgi:hypothetical protein
MALPGSSPEFLNLCSIMGITNHTLGAGVVDNDVFTEPGLPVQQILDMGHTEVRGLALNEVNFGFTDDGALIRAALSQCMNGSCRFAEGLRRERLSRDE